MNEVKKMWLLPLFICTIMSCLALTACGDDDKDEPDVPGTSSANVMTNYGKVTATGVKSMSLFASAHDGTNVLDIPGFAPIRLATSYNIYKHINTGSYLYADDMGNEFAIWEPGSPLPTEFRDQSSSSYILVRTQIKNSDKYVYAYIERVRSLTESTGGMDGNVIGGVIKYISPIDPASFTGFPEK